MRYALLAFAVLAACASALPRAPRLPLHSHTATTAQAHAYETKTFTQRLDHFNFQVEGSFEQRYLVSTEHWRAPDGPIFFYTGNEGPIELFAANTGFMWDIAPEFGAMVVFGEHRYYGHTMPFGNETFKHVSNLQWLTAEQALADYARLLPHVKEVHGAVPSAPVIAFGGSYGGMLTAWFRMKYPSVVAGGIAASAPIWQFTGLTDAEAFSAIITRTFDKQDESEGKVCTSSIRKSWDIIASIAKSQNGLTKLTNMFSFCEPLDKVDDPVNAVYQWLNGAWSYMAMADYPYPASFLGGMPAWPVRHACAEFSSARQSDDEIIASVRAAVNIYYNYTGQAGSCFNVANPDPSTLGGMDSWNYQACTEMILPVSQNGVNDMFWVDMWNATANTAMCQATLGVTPRTYWAETYYGGFNITSASNIVFSNGDLDPWSGGGVLHNLTDSLRAITIVDGAHHLDLRASNDADPASVIWARLYHVSHIKAWIASGGEPIVDHSKSHDSGSNKPSVAWWICLGVAVLLFAILFYRYRRSNSNNTSDYKQLDASAGGSKDTHVTYADL